MDKESDLKSIVDDLNKEEPTQTYNRKYFENNLDTPQNTPSSKLSPGFSLKNIDFDQYFNEKSKFNYDTYSSNIANENSDCCEVEYVGNSAQEFGRADRNNKKICNNLLCMKCDIKVSVFKDQKWDESCDYLFFRNNYGDEIKLGEKIRPSEGTVCYSCQCSWINIDEDFIQVEDLKNISWICAGHLK